MKSKDVVVGNIYQTYIAQELCDVIVVACIPGDPDARWNDQKRMRFRVARVSPLPGGLRGFTRATTPLPKPRSGAALRELSPKAKRAYDGLPMLRTRDAATIPAPPHVPEDERPTTPYLPGDPGDFGDSLHE